MKRLYSKLSIGLFAAVFFMSCATVTTGKFLATDKFKDFKKTSETQVSGSSCQHRVLIFIPIGSGTTGAAFADAIEKSPEGTTGLADAKLKYSFFMLPFVRFIYMNKCYSIEGTPAQRF